jgi:hypothetical protein
VPRRRDPARRDRALGRHPRLVTDELRRTQVRNGILGDIDFDAKGDLVEGPITILRFAHGDFVVERVLRVRPPRPARSAAGA